MTCYIDLYTAVKLNGWETDQVTGAEITVKDFQQVDMTANYLIQHVNRSVDQYGETLSLIHISMEIRALTHGDKGLIIKT